MQWRGTRRFPEEAGCCVCCVRVCSRRSMRVVVCCRRRDAEFSNPSNSEINKLGSLAPSFSTVDLCFYPLLDNHFVRRS